MRHGLRLWLPVCASLLGLCLAGAGAEASRPPADHGQHKVPVIRKHAAPSVHKPRAIFAAKAGGAKLRGIKAGGVKVGEVKAERVIVARRLPARIAAPARRTKRAGHIQRTAPPASVALLPLIVIDAGHGGRDGGAMGVTGLLEKDVTLATALDLQQQLRRQGRFRVALTRTTDAGVSLARRVARARRLKPALFVSIHADASADRKARGASVYIRADTASGAEITRLPANSANAGAIGHALSQGVLQQPVGSALLQYAMVKQLGTDIGMVRDPAREAHLYVLGTVGVPSVLVEMGFLSNPHEEHLLRATRYRRIISTAIRDAIGDYFKEMAGPQAHRT